MSSCPSRQELQQLLDEQLSETGRDAIETHVETCAACQDLLARLSDEEQAAHTQLFCPSAPTPLPASECDFVQRLKENPPAPEEESSPEPITFPGPPTEKGPLGQLDGFAIRKEVGAGRFGVVYQAYDPLDRLVALKILRPELAAFGEERTRFEHEGRKAAAVKHDHIVTIHQVGHTPGFPCPYLVMEYVEGESLSERRHRQGVVPPREAARIVRQVALALADAHARGLVHRDIKPSNILLEAASGRAKLADFGLARVVEGAATSTQRSGIVGTPAYMSPEQINAPHILDRRSDLHSLGVVLYELLTGERPFRAVTHHLLLQQVVHDEPRPPRKLNDAIPRDLQTITLKCLAKEPGRRYQSAGELADDLQRWLDGRPIQAQPVGTVGRFGRWCKRNPFEAAVVALGAITLMAVTALSISLVFNARLDDARNRAVIAGREADSARRQADRSRALLALEGGLSLCEQGEIARGMFRWANSLKIAPEENVDLHRTIRAQLAAWSRQLSPLKTVLPHKGEVIAGGFSSDGKTILTAGEHDIQKWDAATGKPVGPPLQHPRMVSATFSPDGKSLLTASRDSVQLREVETGKKITLPLRHLLMLRAGFSPDGSKLVTAASDQSLLWNIQLWDVATAKPLGTPLQNQKDILAVAVSCDGKTIATVSYKTVHLWDGLAGKPLGPPLEHEWPVRAVAFSPDGKTLVTGSDGKTAQFWDVKSGTRIGPPMQNAGKVGCLSFSPDGQTLCISEDNRCRLWKTASGKPLGAPLMHQGVVNSICFSRDGKRLLTASADKTARLWEVPSTQWAGHALPHGRLVSAAAFNPDGKDVWTASADGAVRCWDVATGNLLMTLNKHSGKVHAMALSRDGKILLTGSWDKTAQLWDVTAGKPLHLLPAGDRVFAVAFSPDGKEVMTGCANGTVQLWDVATGKAHLALHQHRSVVHAVAFGPSGDNLLTGSADWTAQLWDARTGTPLGQPLQHQGWVLSAVFSRDGSTVLTASADGTAQLWDAHTGQRVTPPLQHFGIVHAAVFGPDGRTVLTGSADGTAQLWDARTGQRLGPPFQHQGPVRRVSFSPDGRLVLTASGDKSAQLWDTATGKAFGPPLPHQALIDCLAFSPDGKTLLTGGHDNSARLWEVPVPMEGPREDIILLLSVTTGMDIGEDGSIRIMDVKTWEESRQLLESRADVFNRSE